MIDCSIQTEASAESACRELTLAETAAWLDSYDKYLILCHAHPDGDTLGAGVGLCRLLRMRGKTAYVICASSVPKRLSFITEERETMLLEQLPQDFLWDKVISADIATPSLMGSYQTPFGAAEYVDLAIDHHGTNNRFAKNLYLDASMAACAEIIFDLGMLWYHWNETDNRIPETLAVPLYAGINTDSGSFKYNSVTPETHHRAAILLASGIEHAKLTARLYGSRPLREVMAAKAAYENLRFFHNNQVSLVTFTEDTMKKFGLRDEDIDDIVNLIRGIQGVRVAVHIKPRGENVYKLSLRSEIGVNVAEVCQKFGGGGHPCAAGCTIEGDAASAEEQILSAIGEAL